MTSKPTWGICFLAPLLVLGYGAWDHDLAQLVFVKSTYFLSWLSVLVWAGLYLHVAQKAGPAAFRQWMKDHWPGVVVAFVVTATAALAIEPALRVLSDEANLVGTSKNLFTSRSPTFTVSGKYYYESYWDVDLAIDQRPTLFPFLVSLVHSALGYNFENAFRLNLLLLPAFLLTVYRLAQQIAGPTFSVVATLLVASHPIFLVSVRSGGFDFANAFFALLTIKSMFDALRQGSPIRWAILWMNLCLFAQVRYESALFFPIVIAALLWSTPPIRKSLAPFAWVYALTPAFLLPRALQSILRGSVPKQAPGTVTFSVQNFFDNTYEYFEPLLDFGGSYPAHSALVIGLGLLGLVEAARWMVREIRGRAWSNPRLRFGVFVVAWMLVQVTIVFSYTWGRAQYPSAARLFIPVDTFCSFAAAWALVRWLKRLGPLSTVLSASAVFSMHVPDASRADMMNDLTQTRESAATWRFFEALGQKRILIVTDRPNHFTLMDYGATSFDGARRDPYLFTALSRRLLHDVYVIQQIQLSTGKPVPGYEIWTERTKHVVHEFQNDADVLIRISRLARQ